MALRPKTPTAACLIGLFWLCFSGMLSEAEPLFKKAPEKLTLSNGLDLIYLQDRSSSVTVVHILIKGGLRMEPEGKDGLSFLTTRLCLELPDQISIQRMMNQSTRTTMLSREDFSLIKVACLSEYLDEAVALSTKILVKPLVSGLRIARIKDQMEHRSQQMSDDPVEMAHRAAMENVFKGTPYAHQVYGDQDSRKAIKKKDVEEFYKSAFVAENMAAAVCTDLGREEALAILTPHLEKIPRRAPQKSEPFVFSSDEVSPIFLLKETEQCLVYSAFPLPEATTKHVVLGTILEKLLGQDVESWLWPLRSQMKLAYNVNARAFLLKEAGLLEVYLETDPTKTHKAREALDMLLNKLWRNGLSSEEFQTAQAHSKGAVLRENESKDAKTHTMMTFEALGLGFECLNGFLEAIDSITVEEMNAFIRDVLDPEKSVDILVGPDQSRGVSDSRNALNPSR
ncbi:MAG: M16 family metallopeptidase [Candidatus Aminicenantales bacterium]